VSPAIGAPITVSRFPESFCVAKPLSSMSATRPFTVENDNRKLVRLESALVVRDRVLRSGDDFPRPHRRTPRTMDAPPRLHQSQGDGPHRSQRTRAIGSAVNKRMASSSGRIRRDLSHVTDYRRDLTWARRGGRSPRALLIPINDDTCRWYTFGDHDPRSEGSHPRSAVTDARLAHLLASW
jgi:hypothetical protein